MERIIHPCRNCTEINEEDMTIGENRLGRATQTGEVRFWGFARCGVRILSLHGPNRTGMCGRRLSNYYLSQKSMPLIGKGRERKRHTR
jgi:hypothetical protein